MADAERPPSDAKMGSPPARQDDVVLRAINLGKSYTRYKSRSALLMDRLTGQNRRGDPHWALRNVSFELRKGECLGVIGRNGAGKSTLLALLAGILQPTEGSVEVKGKVLALLELGAGMDPDATGRQNARIHLMVHGVKAGEIEEKLAEVAAFADIGAAFDEPVRTYSSGMFLRVAFAANTVLEPDVLLVDEAMAVGDVFFQQKCHRWVDRRRQGGMALVWVTQDLSEVRRLSDAVLVLQPGRPGWLGDPLVAAHRLIHGSAPPRDGPVEPTTALLEPVPRSGVLHELGAKVRGLGLHDLRGSRAALFRQGEWARILVDYEVDVAGGRVSSGFEIEDAKGTKVHGMTSTEYGEDLAEAASLGPRIRCVHEVRLDVAPGDYTVSVALGVVAEGDFQQRDTLSPADYLGRFRVLARTGAVLAFRVVPPMGAGPAAMPFHGLVRLPGRGEIGAAPPA